MGYLGATSVVQVGRGQQGPASAELLVTWDVGPSIPDVVQVYSKTVGQAGPGDFDGQVNVGPGQKNEFSMRVKAPAFIEVDICPRMMNPDGTLREKQPDSMGIDQYWETFSVSQQIRTAAEAQGGPPVPTLAIVRKTIKTAVSENSITMSWVSYSYNDGDIYWGTIDQAPEFHHSIKPSGAVYHGEFTTDEPLISGATYRFRVQVKNSLTTNQWVTNSIDTAAADNLFSLRRYLAASHLASTGSVREALSVPSGTIDLRIAMGL